MRNKTNQSASPMPKRYSQWVRTLKSPPLWIAIALSICILLCIFSPLKLLLDKSFLVSHLERFGSWAVCLFILVFALSSAIGIPGIMFPVAAGAVFGFVWGSLWSVIGATLGAIGAFLASRYLLRDWAERRFGQHQALMRFNQAVTRQPLAFVLAIRFAPISPFTVVNFLLGLTPISWVPYSVGTFIGIIPGTLAYAWVGVTGEQALQGGDRLPLLLALSFLTLLCVLPILARKKTQPIN
ncbi:TVP38/TMEM64 family protein [Trichocoleus sp. Lan]|uniref:TVP38/TMEM64 family protein n=1 Tax=Trichocoleus sp. Lan TaxID=2933927 RepID=UPI003298AE98